LKPCLKGLRISMDGAYFLFCGAPQNRKGIDSLAQLCQEKLAEDPFSGCVFVFRSRRGTSIRLLTYDGQGYWLHKSASPKEDWYGGRSRTHRRNRWRLMRRSC